VHKSKATALITVILIVAIISITAITMQGYLRGEIHRTQIVIDNDEIYNTLLSLEAWGLMKITEKQKVSNTDTNAVQSVTFNKNEVNSTSKIINQNGLFNINVLSSIKYCRFSEVSPKQALISKIFTNLILNLKDNNLTIEQINKIITSIQEWVCTRNSAEQNITVTDPRWEYQKAGQIFTDISELKLVPGINTNTYNNLKDKITALPVLGDNGAIFDIDAMLPEVFVALAYTDLNTAKQFLEEIKNISKSEKMTAVLNYLKNTNKYSEQEMGSLKDLIALVDDQEKFYSINSIATKHDFRMDLTSLVTVTNNEPRVIWRKRGT